VSALSLAVVALLAQAPSAAEPTPGPPPAPARAHAEVDGLVLEAGFTPGAGTVGDALVLEVQVTAPAGTELGEVQPSKGFEPFMARASDPGTVEHIGDGRVKRVSRFQLALYDTGARTAPELVLAYKLPGGEARTATIPAAGVVIASVLPQGKEPALKDIHDVRGLPRVMSRLWIVLAVAVVLAAILLGVVLGRRRGRTAAAPAVPPLPADEAALKALRELLASPLASAGPAKEFYFHLTEILKTYLGRRFAFDALGDTSDELLRSVRKLGLAEEVRQNMSALLAQADLVKFAAYHPLPAEQKATVEHAFAIVEATRWRPELVAQPAGVGR